MKQLKTQSNSYNSWASMKQRCLNVKATGYDNYGGRGIKITKKWLKFDNFYKDMGERPNGMSLDRIDNDGDYEPSNCIWNDPQGQSEHRRNTLERHKYYKM